MKKSNLLKYVVLLIMVAAMCLTATGCMGGQKDITKADEKKYEAMVAEACEEFGYGYDKETVFPLGSELLYVLSNGEEDMLIEVTIDEESVYEKVECIFYIERPIASVEDAGKGLDQHFDVLVRIAENFTDEITKAELVAYMNDDSLWGEGLNEGYVLEKVVEERMNHGVFEGEDGLVEQFAFGWDNGQKYKLKQDK